jgi:hypothetical protein
VGALELVIVLVLLSGVVVSLVAVVDSASRPAWAYQQAGFEKVLWVTLSAIGIVLSWIGVAGAVWYFVSVRDKVAAAQGAPRLHVPAPPPLPLVAPSARPAEWLADPTRRHELRYWDGARWSDHVSDDGVASYDRLQ